MIRRPDLTELRQMTTPDLRADIEDRIGRLAPTTWDNEPSVLKKVIVLAVALLVTGGTTFALVKAFSGPGTDLRVPGDSETEPLTGEALAESLGLIKHEWSPGQELVSTGEGLEQDGKIVPGCANTEVLPVRVVQELGGFFYCIRAATDLEAWEIAQRLKGHIPTQSEVNEMAAHLSGRTSEAAIVDVPGTGVPIALLNGTDMVGLASIYTQQLQSDGYVIGQPPTDAPMKPVMSTVVYYVDGPDASRNAATAQTIADQYFSGATDPLPPTLEKIIDGDVQVVVVAGFDAAG